MIADIIVGCFYITSVLIHVWAKDVLSEHTKNRRWEDCLLAVFALWTGRVLFFICSIYFSMVLTHYWGFSRLACWGYGVLLILGQVLAAYLLVQLGKGIGWLVTIVWCLVILATCARSADEASD